MNSRLQPETKPARKPPRKLMHVFEVTQYYEDRDFEVRFKCARCGYETPWVDDMRITEIKRGIPCPKCNKWPRKREEAQNAAQ